MNLIHRVPPQADLGILPPFERYEFFIGASEVPFDASASRFSLANAAWLADLCMLAYRDFDEVRPQMQHIGLRTEFFSHESAQCFVCHDQEKVLVAFRGTQVVGMNALEDIVTDADFDLVPFDGRGRVHHGFERDLAALWPALRDHLVSLRAGSSERSLWITGHSMGAGIATLLAARYGKARGIYTFGSPRVGDVSFAHNYREPTYRVVNNNDYVTELPPALPSYVPKLGGRRHVGELHYIDGLGHLHAQAPDSVERLADGVVSALRYQLGSIERFAWLLGYTKHPDRIFHIPLDSLRDHAPIYYATYLWNQLAPSTSPTELEATSER